MPCTYCRPSGLQAWMHPFEVKKERKVQQIKREGKEGPKKNKNSCSPSKVAKELCDIPFFLVEGEKRNMQLFGQNCLVVLLKILKIRH